MPAKEPAADLEQVASSSQADTEPLPFDDDDEQQGQHDAMEDGNAQLPQADTSMNDVDTDYTATDGADRSAQNANNAAFSDALTGLEDADGEEDEDAVGSDDEAMLNQFNDGDHAGSEDETGDAIADGDEAGATQSSAVRAGLSDGSELTDEDDDGDDEEEEEDDDDEMGGGSDDDEDEEDEDDEDDDDDADAEGEDEEGDEDEAAKGLAALTAAATQSNAAGDSMLAETDDESVAGNAGAGLDALAVLAAAGAGDSDHLHGGESDTESVASSVPASVKARRGRLSNKPRFGSRLNEVMVASEPTSEQDEDEDDGHAHDEEGANVQENEEGAEDEGLDEDDSAARAAGVKSHTREMSSLGQLASVAKRNASRSGPTVGLLAGAPAITIEEAASGAPSPASTPDGSVKGDDDDLKEEEIIGNGATEEALKDGEEEREKEAETPAQEVEEAVAEEEPSTDEAAVKRQEALDTLTKIEIGFAVLRDKLYVERMDEISKESEMILEGTHPDLIYLTNFIEARRERRLKLVEMWFDQEQKQYERVAHAEEAAAWSNWRNEVVVLRQRQLDEVSRKRRKLDREKRSLDGPRPARRHQIFETELVRNPDFDAAKAAHIAGGSGKADKHGLGDGPDDASMAPSSGKKADPRQQEMEDLEEMGAYVAYPDLRCADDQEAWMDMERMGIQPDVRLMPGGMGYYRVDEMGLDPYSMYADGAGPIHPGGGPSAELMPPYGAGPQYNGMMMDRIDGRDPGPPIHPPMHGFVDVGFPGGGPPGYGGHPSGGPPPPPPPMHISHRGGHGGGGAGPSEPMFIDERGNYHPAPAPPPVSSRKRAISPSSGSRLPGGKQVDEQRRKADGHNRRRASPPMNSGGQRKNMGGHGPANGGGLDGQKRHFANHGGPGVGGMPPGPPGRSAMLDEGFYDPHPPPHNGGVYGPGSGPGPMMGSPGPMHSPLPPPPPPPGMGRSMHGPSGPGFAPGPARRGEPMYPR